MAKKPRYDWNVIRREYQTAQFTIAELSRRHSCSRTAIQKRRDSEGWHQDHSQEVRALANSRLIEEDARAAAEVAGKVAPCNAKDREMQTEIELAAETRVLVLRKHRSSISKLLEIEDMLIKQLLDDPTKTWVGQFKGDIITHDFGIPVTELCNSYNSLAGATHKRITLERQAFNLNDSDENDDGTPTVILHDPSIEDDR